VCVYAHAHVRVVILRQYDSIIMYDKKKKKMSEKKQQKWRHYCRVGCGGGGQVQWPCCRVKAIVSQSDRSPARPPTDRRRHPPPRPLLHRRCTSDRRRRRRRHIHYIYITLNNVKKLRSCTTGNVAPPQRNMRWYSSHTHVVSTTADTDRERKWTRKRTKIDGCRKKLIPTGLPVFVFFLYLNQKNSFFPPPRTRITKRPWSMITSCRKCVFCVFKLMMIVISIRRCEPAMSFWGHGAVANNNLY